MTKKILLTTALAILFAVPVFAAANNNNQDRDSFRGGCYQRDNGTGNYQNCPYNNDDAPTK
ncbi:hypothetical protein SAMN05660742_11893 [Propionispira arboris]|uniref:Uncharacterized protein n=1 Tax=Propionispira arboris TaxID=84035 RepID=A0A1H7C2H9_9FIRM|nr:hypothetical protein [Propionispira arboris]SEJ82757.1 hypothetical protein SAMN05660742_11893 [Propionispira arboris]